MGQPVNSAPATDVDPLQLRYNREPSITADANTICASAAGPSQVLRPYEPPVAKGQ